MFSSGNYCHIVHLALLARQCVRKHVDMVGRPDSRIQCPSIVEITVDSEGVLLRMVIDKPMPFISEESHSGMTHIVGHVTKCCLSHECRIRDIVRSVFNAIIIAYSLHQVLPHCSSLIRSLSFEPPCDSSSIVAFPGSQAWPGIFLTQHNGADKLAFPKQT